MSCYECGSPEGNEARLCKSCNEKRLTSHVERVEQLAPRFLEQPPAQMTPIQWLLAGLGSFLFVSAMIWLLGSHSGSTSASSPGQQAYTKCILKLKQKIAEESLKKEQDDSVISASATCVAIKEACDKDPNSKMCTFIPQDL